MGTVLVWSALALLAAPPDDTRDPRADDRSEVHETVRTGAGAGAGAGVFVGAAAMVFGFGAVVLAEDVPGHVPLLLLALPSATAFVGGVAGAFFGGVVAGDVKGGAQAAGAGAIFSAVGFVLLVAALAVCFGGAVLLVEVAKAADEKGYDAVSYAVGTGGVVLLLTGVIATPYGVVYAAVGGPVLAADVVYGDVE